MTDNSDRNQADSRVSREPHPLAEVVQSLTEVVTSSEDDFMALGMNLQQVQMMSTTQRKKITAAMDLFQKKDEQGVLRQISRYVEESQQATRAAQQTAGDLCGNLASMLKLMDSISRKSHTLERVGMFLRVIGINTGVECARHTAMEQMFKVVSKDTINLAEQIRLATDQLLDQTARAKADQSQTLSEARQSIEALEDLVKGSQQATETALEKVAELVNYSISMVNEAERMAVKISSEINRVVVGIQFHDNLRQRIEHVNAALLETAVVDETSPVEEVGTTYLNVELQKAQLDHLIDELDSLYQTQAQALQNIINEVSCLKERLQGMATEPSALPTRQNPVQVLIKGISALEDLNSDSRTLGDRIRASAEHAEEIVDDMQTAIKNTFAIATHVKINALNAIIKAAKFGHSGEALQVLAQSMVTVAGDTRNLVSVFEQLLGQLSHLTRHDEAATAEVATMAEEPFDSARMQQVFADFRSELETSRQDCQSLSASLEKELGRLHFIADLKAALQRFSALLGDYAASIAPEDEELLARLRIDFGEQMHSRYTMDKERDIHNRLKGGAVAAAPAAGHEVLLFDGPDAAAAETSDVDLWGDAPTTAATDVELWGDEDAQPEPAAANVELWEEDSPQPPAAGNDEGDIELWGQPAAEPEPASGDVELWDDAPAPGEEIAAEKEQKKQPEDDFGDNVELF